MSPLEGCLLQCVDSQNNTPPRCQLRLLARIYYSTLFQPGTLWSLSESISSPGHTGRSIHNYAASRYKVWPAMTCASTKSNSRCHSQDTQMLEGHRTVKSISTSALQTDRLPLGRTHCVAPPRAIPLVTGVPASIKGKATVITVARHSSWSKSSGITCSTFVGICT